LLSGCLTIGQQPTGPIRAPRAAGAARRPGMHARASLKRPPSRADDRHHETPLSPRLAKAYKAVLRATRMAVAKTWDSRVAP
jgi:hypothetical protein